MTDQRVGAEQSRLWQCVEPAWGAVRHTAPVVGKAGCCSAQDELCYSQINSHLRQIHAPRANHHDRNDDGATQQYQGNKATTPTAQTHDLALTSDGTLYANNNTPCYLVIHPTLLCGVGAYRIRPGAIYHVPAGFCAISLVIPLPRRGGNAL